MNVLQDRIAEAAADAQQWVNKLIDNAPTSASPSEIMEALVFTAIQCDIDEDDPETVEAVFLARLADNMKTGER